MNKNMRIIPPFNDDDYVRFWSKAILTANPDKCWIFPSGNKKTGLFKMKGVDITAPRIAYYFHFKVNPMEKEVRHACPNRNCVNPNHLFLYEYKYDNGIDQWKNKNVVSDKPKPIPPLSEKDIKRFWSKINIPIDKSGCWNWTAGLSQGYGNFCTKYGYFKAHRIAYFLSNGVDPGELMVCHTCDNRICCNASHHFIGTNRDNMEDMAKKGRAKCRKGENHPFVINPELAAKGEANGNSKLSKEDVIDIRKKYNKGDISYDELGKQFGVSVGTIGRVVSNKNWKHI